MNDELEQFLEALHKEDEFQYETTNLWVISYSDFMTILMIFFMMLFAHRVWNKKVSWEAERIAQLQAVRESQKGMIQRLNRLADVDVKAERIDIHLPDTLLFDAGKAELRSSAQLLLAKISPELAAFKGDIIVEGHTDSAESGVGQGFRSKWELSVTRAFSVINCLMDNGIRPEQISARGYGPYRPRVPNNSADNRAMNRRIEIVLLNAPQGRKR